MSVAGATQVAPMRLRVVAGLLGKALVWVAAGATAIAGAVCALALVALESLEEPGSKAAPIIGDAIPGAGIVLSIDASRGASVAAGAHNGSIIGGHSTPVAEAF